MRVGEFIFFLVKEFPPSICRRKGQEQAGPCKCAQGVCCICVCGCVCVGVCVWGVANVTGRLGAILNWAICISTTPAYPLSTPLCLPSLFSHFLYFSHSLSFYTVIVYFAIISIITMGARVFVCLPLDKWDADRVTPFLPRLGVKCHALVFVYLPPSLHPPTLLVFDSGPPLIKLLGVPQLASVCPAAAAAAQAD